MALSLRFCGALSAAENGGAPSATAAPVFKYNLASKAYFEPASSTLTAQGADALSKLMAWVRQRPTKILLFGYPSSGDTPQSDADLSAARSAAVGAFLVSHGLGQPPLMQFPGPPRVIEIHILPEKTAGAAVAAAKSGTQTEAANSPAPLRYALGLGYPDLRARVDLGHFDLEAKLAAEQGIQVYSARLYWYFWKIGPVKAMLGLEGGFADFNGFYNALAGSGVFEEGFVGLEYPITRRMSINADVGPAHVGAWSEGYTYSTTDVIYNTALYIYLF